MGGVERAEHEVVQVVEIATAAPQVEIAPALQVGHAFDPAEREADQVADRVIARMRADAPLGGGELDTVRRAPAGPGAGVEGGPAGADVEAGIAGARGKGAPLDPSAAKHLNASGVGTSGIGVHTGGNADALCRAVGARAFSVGQDIFFARGQYQPDTEAGLHLIAHEAAHTHQGGGGIGRSVRRRLAGSAMAAERAGGGTSSDKKRQFFGVLKNWDDVLHGLYRYEEQELLLDDGDEAKFLRAKPAMLKQLKAVDKSLTQWNKANAQSDDTLYEQEFAHAARSGGEAPTKKKGLLGKARGLLKSAHAAVSSKEASRQQAAAGEAKQEQDRRREEISHTDAEQDVDTRTKAGRRQAVAHLEPRVGAELKLLENADPAAWMGSFGLNPFTLQERGGSASGQKNSVQELEYKQGDVSFKGYFKQDAGFAANPESHELNSGIRRVDPRYGARAVAMYKLDRLLNAGVTARAEFAVDLDKDGNAVFGTVLESAKGKSSDKWDVATDKAHKDALGDGAISLEDKVLQRGINKLQILDAIAGQLDRHSGNYYIQADSKGNVTGVTGIDLDMAFGRDMHHHSAKPEGAFNYMGLPKAIDEEMGRAILALKSSDIEQALYGLLPEPEIRATVNRFESVQEAVREAESSGGLRSDWGVESAKERPDAATLGFGSGINSYSDSLAGGAKETLENEVTKTVQDIAMGVGAETLRSGLEEALFDLSQPQREALVQAFLTGSDRGYIKAITAFLYDSNVPIGTILDVVGAVLSEFLPAKLLSEYTLATEDMFSVKECSTKTSLLTAAFKKGQVSGICAPFAKQG